MNILEQARQSENRHREFDLFDMELIRILFKIHRQYLQKITPFRVYNIT